METIYAYKGVQKVGHLKYDIIRGDEQVPAHIELLAVWVNPQFQGKSYGTGLINALIKLAKEQKISSIYTFVTKENEQYKHFITKNGFVPDGKKELWHQSWS